MSLHPFSLSNLGLVLISAGLLFYVIFLWRYCNRKASPKAINSFQKPVAGFAVIYGLYFLALCVLAGSGFFTVVTTPPRFLLLFLPVLLIVALLSRAKLDGSLQSLSVLPPVFLLGVQVMRIPIELIFLQFAREKIIPAAMSLHGRNFDLLIGVLAIPVSVLFLQKHAWARKAGIAFNILGLVSLTNIFSIAIPSLPSTFRIYDTLYLPTYFPGILIVFLASSAVYLHVLSLRQLMAMKKGSFPRQKNTAPKPAVLQSA